MCIDNPMCSIPPPIGLVNMAANHVELQHGVTITSDARQLLSDRIAHAQPTLEAYLKAKGLSHVDLVRLAEKQFVQGFPHASALSPTGQQAPPSVDARAVQAGIAIKSWSPLWM
jgi:hypothetical protein